MIRRSRQADRQPRALGRTGLLVNTALGVSSVADLVAQAEDTPGKLTFSSAGIGSPAHFGGELFRVIANVDMVHVPYKGAAPAISAAVSNEVSLMFGPIAQGLPHVKSASCARSA